MTENQNAALSAPIGSGPGLKGESVVGVLKYLLPVLLAVLLIIAYCLSFAAPPLADEKFLLFWMKESPKLHGASGFSGFMSWSGFDLVDSWGPASKLFLLVFSFLFGKNILLFKFLMFCLHVSCTALTYLCSRSILQSRLAAFFAAALFAFYPLHFEATVWLGGIGVELATLFFLFAFYVYLGSRQGALNWGRMAIVTVLMFLALSSSAVIWPACLVFCFYEFFDFVLPGSLEDNPKRDLSAVLISSLLPIVITGVYLAGSGVLGAEFLPDFKFGNCLSYFKHLFLPVNEINWHRYSREYVGPFIIYGFAFFSFLAGLVFSPTARRASLISFSLFLLMAVPLIGVAMPDSALYGERWLYPASALLCCFLASFLSGSIWLGGRLKCLGMAFSSILTLLLCIFFFRHLWNENGANLSCARVIRAVQKSMKILHEKERSPLLIVRDLPEKMSVSPIFSPRGPVVYDAERGLMRSNVVPDGRLKELLRADALKGSTFRWEKNMKSFVPFDHFALNAILPESINAEGIVLRMQPPLEAYRNVRLSEDKSYLELDSNSENGPMISLQPNELSTIDGDYIYLDAIIDAPTSYASPRIELHWQTRVHENYEKRERFAYVNATINDGKVHRYLLSLRGNGWTTGGMPTIIAFGFPAGAKVRLSGMGLLRHAKDIAQLKDASDAYADQSRNRFTPPYINYPVDPKLGLIALNSNAKEIVSEYSVSDLAGADGVWLEVSYPNRSFDDANSNHLSGQTYKTFSLSGKSAKITIPISSLAGPGVYSLRVIARDSNGSYLGQFSDPLCYQVPRVSKE